MGILQRMRDYFVIGSMVVVVAAVGAVLFYFGPTSLRTDVASALSASIHTTTNVTYTPLAQGNNAISITDKTNYRITNQDDLIALWALIYTNKVNPPTIDFTKYEVLGVFDGSHSTNGYGISVSSILDENGNRTVTVTHSSPGPTCKTNANATSPFEVIQVPTTSFIMSHQDVSATTAC